MTKSYLLAIIKFETIFILSLILASLPFSNMTHIDPLHIFVFFTNGILFNIIPALSDSCTTTTAIFYGVVIYTIFMFPFALWALKSKKGLIAGIAFSFIPIFVISAITSIALMSVGI